MHKEQLSLIISKHIARVVFARARRARNRHRGGQ
jgi:hypothetical protein